MGVYLHLLFQGSFNVLNIVSPKITVTFCSLNYVAGKRCGKKQHVWSAGPLG